MDNKQLFVDINETKKDLKQRGGLLGILLAFVGLSTYHNIRNTEYFQKIAHYFDFGLRILGMIAIVAILYYLFFLRKSKKNLIINEIIKVTIDKLEFETEVTLKFSNKREYEVNFRNLENQLEPFIEEIKKRNTRVEISNI